MASTHVVLAVDDFSRAGKPVLQFAQVKGAKKQQLCALPLLSPEFAAFVQQYEFVPVDSAASFEQVSFLTVDTASVPEGKHWALAEAVMELLGDVQKLTLLASLHLPHAKPASSSPLHSVFYAALNSSESSEFQRFDTAAWEVKQPFLSCLLHLIKIEQAPVTQCLFAKGYKPGRDHEGTKEAVQALSAALAQFTSQQIIVEDVQTLVSSVHLLQTASSSSEKTEQHELLYQ